MPKQRIKEILFVERQFILMTTLTNFAYVYLKANIDALSISVIDQCTIYYLYGASVYTQNHIRFLFVFYI